MTARDCYRRTLRQRLRRVNREGAKIDAPASLDHPRADNGLTMRGTRGIVAGALRREKMADDPKRLLLGSCWQRF